ncbi:MAG: hypothetical protein JXO22_08945 [Phycisphaerae bacterium]|nr:hypothetical protein [Phycisphaerae bacterium]
MRKLVVLALVMGFVGVASAQVIWADDFDGYADQAAMDAVYTQAYPAAPALLDQTKGFSDGQSVHFGQPTVNYTEKMYKNFGQEVDGTDAAPLKVEFMVDLDTIIWSTRQYIELRGYLGAGYADGALEDLFAQGFTSSGVDTAKVSGRLIGGPEAGWFSYNADKSLDWMKLTMLVKSTTVEYYVNDVLDTTKTRGGAVTYDCIVIGSGLSSAGADVWFDDLVVEIIPEPASLMLLGLLALIRRR